MLLSLVLHVTAVIGAVTITAAERRPDPPPAPDHRSVIWLTSERPLDPTRSLRELGHPPVVVAVPDDWRSILPSVSIDVSSLPGLSPVFAPTAPRSGGTGSIGESRTALAGVPAPSSVWTAALADEAPTVLACREPAYPSLLRAAGIEGRVVLELVIDTTGIADPDAALVIESPPTRSRPRCSRP